MLAYSLPDRYGNTLVNAWLKTHGQDPNSLNPVEMLLYTGNRAIGAFEFVPAYHKMEKSSVIKVEQVFNVVNNMLTEKAGMAASLDDDADSIDKIILMGSSVGGARAKALIAWNEQTNEVMSGHAEVPESYSQWILKFDGIKNDILGSPEGFGRIEMAYYEMAKAAGITMMPSQLYEENGRAHFMTKRFDRIAGTTKIHFQSQYGLRHLDFHGSAYGYAHSYEQVFQTMRGLILPYPDAEEVFQRIVFNIATCNMDDHSKNLGFLMNETGKWQLAPAYDLTFTYNPANLGGTQHSLSLNNK